MVEKGIDERTGTIEFGEKAGSELFGSTEVRPAREEVAGRELDRPEPTGMPLYGRAAIASALAGMSWPLERRDLAACAGARTFEFRRGQPLTLRQALSRLEEQELASEAQATDLILATLDQRTGADRRVW